MKENVNFLCQHIRGKKMSVHIADNRGENLDTGSKHNPCTEVFLWEALNNKNDLKDLRFSRVFWWNLKPLHSIDKSQYGFRWIHNLPKDIIFCIFLSALYACYVLSLYYFLIIVSNEWWCITYVNMWVMTHWLFRKISSDPPSKCGPTPPCVPFMTAP